MNTHPAEMHAATRGKQRAASQIVAPPDGHPPSLAPASCLGSHEGCAALVALLRPLMSSGVGQDDDGLAYVAYSSEGNLVMHISQLAPDYLSPLPVYVRRLINRRREAPSIFKHSGWYFMLTSGCTGWEPNRAEVFATRWDSRHKPCETYQHVDVAGFTEPVDTSCCKFRAFLCRCVLRWLLRCLNRLCCLLFSEASLFFFINTCLEVPFMRTTTQQRLSLPNAM